MCSYFLQAWTMGLYEDSTVDVTAAGVSDEAASSSMAAMMMTGN